MGGEIAANIVKLPDLLAALPSAGKHLKRRTDLTLAPLCRSRAFRKYDSTCVAVVSAPLWNCAMRGNGSGEAHRLAARKTDTIICAANLTADQADHSDCRRFPPPWTVEELDSPKFRTVARLQQDK
jgi:hypothetical protein